MKLIVAIVRDEDASRLSDGLVKRTLGPRPAGADRRATVFVLDASKFEQV
jgi:uncharacterized protein YaaQ